MSLTATDVRSHGWVWAWAKGGRWITVVYLLAHAACSVPTAFADDGAAPARQVLIATATCLDRADAGPWAFFPLPGQDAATLKGRALTAYVDEHDAPPLGVPIRQATVRGYREGKGVIVQCNAAGDTIELWGWP